MINTFQKKTIPKNKIINMLDDANVLMEIGRHLSYDAYDVEIVHAQQQFNNKIQEYIKQSKENIVGTVGFLLSIINNLDLKNEAFIQTIQDMNSEMYGDIYSDTKKYQDSPSRHLCCECFDLTHNDVIRLRVVNPLKKIDDKKTEKDQTNHPIGDYVQLFEQDLQNDECTVFSANSSVLMLIPYEKNKENTSFSYYVVLLSSKTEKDHNLSNQDAKKINFADFIEKIGSDYKVELLDDKKALNDSNAPSNKIQDIENIPKPHLASRL